MKATAEGIRREVDRRVAGRSGDVVNTVLAALAMGHRMSNTCGCDYCDLCTLYVAAKQYHSYIRSRVDNDTWAEVHMIRNGMSAQRYSNWAARCLSDSLYRVERLKALKDAVKAGCASVEGIRTAMRMELPGVRKILFKAGK